jgi:hypothetical protein
VEFLPNEIFAVFAYANLQSGVDGDAGNEAEVRLPKEM